MNSQASRHRPSSRGKSQPAAASGLVGNVAKFLITRSVLRRVGRVGGLQGMLISAAATYALDRYLHRRR